MNPFKKKKNDMWDIRALAIRSLTTAIDEYADWYAENGLSLPEEYQFDPAGYTEVLRQIQRAFYLASTENDEDGEIQLAKKSGDTDLIAKLNDDMQSGFSLFGKSLNFLYDKYQR